MAVNRVDFEAAVERKCEAFAKNYLARKAQEAEQYAKDEAEWKDHTHDLRKGIRGGAFYRPGTDMGIILAHTIWYGIFVEKKHGPPNPDPEKRHDSDWWEKWAASGEAAAWLETADDGKYAILKPALDHFLPEIKDELMRVFGGKG
jgi:hypothetical protein